MENKLDISCELSAQQTIHMEYQAFCWKYSNIKDQIFCPQNLIAFAEMWHILSGVSHYLDVMDVEAYLGFHS